MTYEAASGPVEALTGISLSVGAGEFVSLVGPAAAASPRCCASWRGLRPATVGNGDGRWPHRARAHSRHRHGLPGAHPAEMALDPAERAAAGRARRPGRRRLARPRRAAPRHGGAEWVRRQAAARTVGRHAAARRAVPRPAARPAAAADGRALRRTRRHDPGRHGARAACASGASATLPARRARPSCSSPIRSPRRSSCPIAWWSCRHAPAASRQTSRSICRGRGPWNCGLPRPLAASTWRFSGPLQVGAPACLTSWRPFCPRVGAAGAA